MDIISLSDPCNTESAIAPAQRALRPYQSDASARFWACVRSGTHRRILMVAPTGAGKTILSTDVIETAVSDGKRVVVMVHRSELVHQQSEKLFHAGIDFGTIKAGLPTRPSAPVQVASVQTLHARSIRTERAPLPRADIVIVDECHHATARSWKAIMDAFPKAIILGMTATPCRGDGRGLGNIFDTIMECSNVAELTAQGYLVPAVYYAPSKPDLSGVKIERGDYVEGQLAERMDKPKLTGDIVENWLKHGKSRRTVVFCTTVAHSVHTRDAFRDAGVLAEHIDGNTPEGERKSILARLKAGKIDVVCNCMILTEGWDQPEVSCLILARPTKHMGLYRQMVGRVLRPAPGKTDALILDHSGAVFEHGFVDEPVRWTLKTDKRADNPVQEARAAGQQPGLSTCPECTAVRMRGGACPSCGWHPTPKAAAVEVAEGQLGRVDRSKKVEKEPPSAAGKLNFFRQLVWIAEERSYKSGWAAQMFRRKFEEWPPVRDAIPLEPEATTRSWVRSRQIAFAKGMARRAA